MSSLQQLFTSRKPYDASTFVGQEGKIFYDEQLGLFRLGDGVTPGGLPIPFTIATTSTVGGIKPGAGLDVTSSGTLTVNTGPSFFFDEDALLRLRAGTTSTIGGVKSGNGIVIASDGTINLDTEGLSFVFGDFFASTPEVDGSNVAALSSVNENQDIVLYSNGTGAVNIVGELNVFATDGDIPGAMSLEPFFRILEDGQVRILVPLADTVEGGVEIIGSALGTAITPGIAGTMLHLTGNADLPTRVYHDTLGSYSSYVFRRYNGSVLSPTAVLANEDIGRMNWTAATSSGMGSTATAQIAVTALENQTPTAQGSKITFTVTPVGSAVTSRVNVANITVADGVTATKFTGPLAGTASTATNLAAATNILAGTLSVNPPNTGKNASAIGTYTIAGLTTSHKIVVMPQAALPDFFNIAGAWASALNTVSINFQTYAGGIDAPTVTVAYWAWI